MKASIPRHALAHTLGIVKNAAARSGTLPILSNVRIEALPNLLRFTCTDLDTTLTCNLTTQGDQAVKVDEPGDLTVPVSLLTDLIRSFVGDAPVLVESTKTLLKVSHGKSDYSIGQIPAEEFPPAATLDKATTFTLPQATLKRLLNCTEYPIHTADETRYVLHGAYLNLNGKITVATTDGRRLAQATEAFPELGVTTPPDAIPQTPSPIIDTIIPRRCVEELLRLLTDEEEAEYVTVSITPKALRFQFGGITLTSKAIEGTFPNYKQIIPAMTTPTSVVSRTDLLTALRRVSLISREKCSLEFEGQMLTITGRSENKDLPGKASESLLIPKVAAPLCILFNPRFLIESLEAVTDDELNFYASTDKNPGVFATQDNRWLGMTMCMLSA